VQSLAEQFNVEKVNIAHKFTLFNEFWVPYIVGELNDAYVKVDKLKGKFVWHKHDAEDELFLVTKGKLLIKLREKDIWINEGEFVIIPKGVEHMPVADEEVHVVLIEPKLVWTPLEGEHLHLYNP
jgi:mannose-6-phosphate isomerase-like protein (cupin superfamily)